MKIKNTNVESVPFASVEITDKVRNGKTVAWFDLYLSERPGVYGHQVCFEGNDYRNNAGRFEGKTGGCGYCKDSQATQDCAAIILGGYDHARVHDSADRIFRAYHKGGNFYKMSLAQLKKAVKR